MNIAYCIKTNLNENALRGVGVYSRLLLEYLSKNSNIDIQLFSSIEEVNSACDIIHYPFFDPFYLTLKFKKNIPTVVTIHDLIPIQYKNNFDIGIRGRVKWIIQKNNILKCAKIITDSQSS